MNQLAQTGNNEFVRKLLLEHQLVDIEGLQRADEARKPGLTLALLRPC